MDLRQRAITSAGWYLGSRAVIQTLSWVVTILVARWLTPVDYGLFAMALTLVAAAEMFQELGLASAIVQRHDLSAEQVNGVFWLVAGIGFALAGGLYLAADLGARFYGEPGLAPVVRVVAAALFLHALATVPQSLLTREIDFRRRSLSDTFGVGASAVVTVLGASLGYGVWALVCGYLATAGVRAVILWIQAGWWPGRRTSWTAVRSVLRFGLDVTGASVLRSLWVIGNRVIVGRLLGGGALGHYSMADAIATGPHRMSSAVIQQLSLPVFSRLQREDERLRRYFLRITKYVAVIVLPVQVGMALVGPDLVPAVLPEAWRPMLGLFQALSLAQVFMALSLPAGALLVARGHPGRLMRYNMVFASAMLVGVLAGTRFGLPGVAAAWLLLFPPLRLGLVALAARELSLSPAAYLRPLLPPAAATILMAAAVASVRLLEALQAGALERLGASVAAGALVYVAALFLLDRPLGSEFHGILRDLLARPAK